MNFDQVLDDLIQSLRTIQFPLNRQLKSANELFNYLPIDRSIITKYLDKCELSAYSSIATCLLIQPINWLVVRSESSGQIKGDRAINIHKINSYIYSSIRLQGLSTFYRGLIVSSLSHTCYFTGSYVIYSALFEYEEKVNSKVMKRTAFDWINGNFSFGFISGAISSIMSHPFDYISQSIISNNNRSNYFSTRFMNRFSLYHIYKILSYNKSLIGIYNYLPINVFRGGLLYGVMVKAHRFVDLYIRYFELVDKDSTDIVSTAVSAYITALIVSPIDMIVCRLFSQHHLNLGDSYNKAIGKRFYQNALDCFLHCISINRFWSLWRGLIPLGTKLAFTFILQKQFHHLLYESIDNQQN